MDVREGTLHDDSRELREALKERPLDVETFGYDEVVQVKTGFFQVVKIDIRCQRLVLKPISRAKAEQIAGEARRRSDEAERRAER